MSSSTPHPTNGLTTAAPGGGTNGSESSPRQQQSRGGGGGGGADVGSPAPAFCRMCRIVPGDGVERNQTPVVTHMPLSADVPQHCQLAIEMIADLHCPWCFIGLRVLQRALASVPPCVRKTFRVTPFQLGSCPSKSTCKRTYMVSHYGEGKVECMMKTFQTLGRSLGINFNPDGRIGPVGHAYRLAMLAAEHGKALECWDLLFQGYFERGLDLSDMGVLACLGQHLGIPNAAEFLASTRLANEVERVLKVDRGIRGVPHFVINNTVHLAGAQPLGQFLAAFERLGIARVAAAPGASPASAAAAAATGCPKQQKGDMQLAGGMCGGL